MLLSFASLAKVFIQRCSHESCDMLYISQERGWVGGHGDFSSSAVVVTRKCEAALKLPISIGNRALQFQFYTYILTDNEKKSYVASYRRHVWLKEKSINHVEWYTDHFWACLVREIFWVRLLLYFHFYLVISVQSWTNYAQKIHLIIYS